MNDHMSSGNSWRVGYHRSAHDKKICPQIILYNFILSATIKLQSASKLPKNHTNSKKILEIQN